ncbi:ALA-interacting subunit 3 [Senna tora]|uniref:ALA-interacting subunit n=1 Tax=Senna tora TaxID=362788 RepID=A0A834TKI1_9FABA|nr:ALA-interacting subunit 3 [Senna tora]
MIIFRVKVEKEKERSLRNSSSDMASSSSGGAGSADVATARRHTKRPKYSKFTQQELPACKPILTPRAVISSFLIVSVFFIPIGVASLLASNDVVEIIDRYESECIPESFKNNKVEYIQSSADKTCNRILNVTKNMKSPIYVYYQLDNFYQNHRRQKLMQKGCAYCIDVNRISRYVKSRSDEQLRDPKNVNSTDSCKPEDLFKGNAIVPCGLIAWSLFNDTYIFSRDNNNLTVNKKGISWKSDREHKFGKNVFPKNFQNSSVVGGAHLDESIPVSFFITDFD